MSYQSDDGQHEGWAAAEFPDGRFSVGSGTPEPGKSGALVRFLDPARDSGEPELLDGRTAIGWRGVCECGWRGPLWGRVADPAQHAPAGRRVFDPGPSVYGDVPSEAIEDAIYREWLGHLPSTSLTDVRDAAEDAHKAEARLTEAVQRARADGCSWADIGEAVGIARQSAHERWAKR
jgi:hypothetical protein